MMSPSAESLPHRPSSAKRRICTAITSEPGRAYTWDADNRLTAVSVQNPAPYKPSAWTFLYDPAGGRIEKAGPDGTIQYFGLAELVGGQLVQYYLAGNVLVAREATAGTTFYHADRLGSVRLMTNAAGNQVKTYEYASYGQTLAETGAAANEVGFTGHRRDQGSGLVYMARGTTTRNWAVSSPRTRSCPTSTPPRPSTATPMP